MTTFSNRSYSRTADYAATAISGEPGDPPANACAALTKIGRTREMLMRSSELDDNDLVSLGYGSTALRDGRKREIGKNLILGMQKLRRPTRVRGELLRH